MSTPIRTLVSSMPIEKSSQKPRAGDERALTCPGAFGSGPGPSTAGRKPMARATATPARATSQSDGRQGIIVSSSEVAAGTAAFPRSPEKL